MSAIIGSLIPKIEGFQPIPNAVMIPFMEAQSAALAYAFGLNYEYGKRKVRSMSNDEFNSLTSENITNMSNEHTHIILSKFQAQIPHVMPAQSDIFDRYQEIERLKLQENVKLFKWAVAWIKANVDDALAHSMGGHISHDVIAPPTYQDPNNPDIDFAPPPGSPPPATTSPDSTVSPTPPPILPTQLISVTYVAHSNGNTTTKYRTLSEWQKRLKGLRDNLRLRTPIVAKLHQNEIIAIQNKINPITNSFN